MNDDCNRYYLSSNTLHQVGLIIVRKKINIPQLSIIFKIIRINYKYGTNFSERLHLNIINRRYMKLFRGIVFACIRVGTPVHIGTMESPRFIISPLFHRCVPLPSPHVYLRAIFGPPHVRTYRARYSGNGPMTMTTTAMRRRRVGIFSHSHGES